ncbi:MAG: DUF4435 domain-containing protein, partial [Allobaculum sp.]|nr:DUF4435 domain-containing protein [Allobaculum sp.]
MIEMTPKDLLSKAQQAFTTAFERFSLIARKNRSSIVCFVEGQDKDYYKIRIEVFSGDCKEFIPCGNKKNVLTMYERLNSTDAYDGMR